MKLLVILFASITLIPLAYSINLQLADYEDVDPAVTPTTPDSSASCKIVSGGGATPIPSSGAKMLELSWSNETDRKVEVKHDWNGLLEFDLDGNDRILVDIYIPSNVVSTVAGLPTLLGLWDYQIGWQPTLDAIVTDQWVTYGFNISANTDLGLNAIDALVFQHLGSDAGTIYIDNIRISSALMREQALHADGPLITVDSDLRLTDYDGSGNPTDLYVEGTIEATSITVDESIEINGSQVLTQLDLPTGEVSLAGIALGSHSTASGQYATALGSGAKATAFHSLAFGYNIGAYNAAGGGDTTWIDTDPLFELGNGRDDANRSNALTILKNGQATLTNIYWDPNEPDVVPSNPNASAGQALQVEGHTHLAGNAHVVGNIDAASITVDGNGSRRWQLISTSGNATEGQGVFVIKDFAENHSSGGNRHFAIYPNGSVAIGPEGHIAPTSKLHVSGNIVADTPTAPEHVATKAYVDDLADNLIDQDQIDARVALALKGLAYSDKIPMYTPPAQP